jgi:nifR3 family TIM-barrel protein
MKNFWEKLPKTFFCLAPMADVTDAAFRRIITKYGGPDVFWTEFVSADGLMSVGREVLKDNLIYSKNENPIVVQLFSSNPIKMRQAVKYVASLGFDGIDINMGCPDKSIEKQGAGAAMMKNMEKAREIIQAVKDGIKDSKTAKGQAGKKVSISIKTRVGYNKSQLEEWIPFLLSQNIDALTIHARTRKEMSKVPANWNYVKRVVEIRNEMKAKTKIIGNGDVVDIEDGLKKAKETGCDGIMIGRAIFGNPWLFSSLGGKRPYLKGTRGKALRSQGISLQEKLKVLVEHTKMFERLLGKNRNFAVMKKHFKAYVNGFDGAKELRVELMETKNAKEVEKIVNKFLKKNK